MSAKTKTSLRGRVGAGLAVVALCACTLQFEGEPHGSLPTLTTNTPSNVTATSATLGGNITDAGTPPYTERGVVYATTENPTTDHDKKVITSAGTTGNFSDVVTGLTANTTYYARAYAINTAGTAYGGQVSFTTLPGNVPVTGITLNKEMLTLGIGEGEKLIVSITPSNATNKQVAWMSSDTSVATVSDNGEVTATGEGVAVITVVTDEGSFMAQCTVYMLRVIGSNSNGICGGRDIYDGQRKQS